MELDGISQNPSQLGEAARGAMAYLSSHIKSHSTSLKVQTSKGNYLSSLNVRTEEVDFSSGNPERNMDDLILKTAIWHEEHWVDRSAFLQSNSMTIANPVKVVLLSLDRNCMSCNFVSFEQISDHFLQCDSRPALDNYRLQVKKISRQF